MSISADTSGWELVGETFNARYYLIETRIVAVVPHPKSQDSEATAKENVDLQVKLCASQGSGVVIVFVDNLVSQDKAARRVYGTRPDPEILIGCALLCGSILGRAIGSFFLGLSRPKVKIKMFGRLEDAVAWAHEILPAPSRKEVNCS